MSATGDEPVHLILSIDFGETNSAVCYAMLPKGMPPRTILPEHVHTVTNYPNSIMDRKGDPMNREVATQMVYSRNWKFQPLAELISQQPAPTTAEPIGAMIMHPDHRIDTAEETEIHDQIDQPLWGEQAHDYFSESSWHSDPSVCLVENFKTMFDRSGMHEEHNDRITENLRASFGQGVAKEKFSSEKVIHCITVDFLTCILQHSKKHIISKHTIMGKRPNIVSTETVICVPIKWCQKAYRDLQSCMTVAMRQVGFPGVGLKDNIIDKVFLVSEPEAGATWLLSGGYGIRQGEIIVIIDSGGGTTDASTFKVTGELPKRLEAQLVPHSDQFVGDLFRKRLQSHRYLEKDGITIEAIVQELVCKFKQRIKPHWDIFNDNTSKHLDVRGLKPSPNEPNIGRNRVIIRADEIKKIFEAVLIQVERIMLEQLTASKYRGLNVDRVVLMGGFADSPSYYEHLRRSLATFNEKTGCAAKLHRPPLITVVDAVAAGGVLRAANKENGPKRIARSSYGIGRSEIWDKKLHEGQRRVKGIHNGKDYARTIQWMIKLGQEIKPDKEYRFECEYTFAYKNASGLRNKGPFELCDEIWVSDTASQSHLGADGEHNKGSENLGLMKTDVAQYQEYFVPRFSKSNRKYGKGRREYWALEYLLLFKVDGLNMTCRQVLILKDSTEKELNKLRVSIAPGINLGAS
ncbi:hypothetical protein FSARC_4843 [Fusarium sarcochroum]|uniref:Uncharacterized protein n=1 Tax=Fusarium sarcochroum TaxID=1208366 RepID=A0A8H4U0S2_9HYPO|nr:hypothetical protein FSARC_4843 [Fusarium sarcochroum]